MAGSEQMVKQLGYSWAITLSAGLLLITTCMTFTLIDVHHRGGLVVGGDTTADQLNLPQNRYEQITRIAAMNITPLCWVGYLLLFDGLLTLQGRWQGRPRISSLRTRPNRFIVAWLTSIPVWCYFDWLNFYFLDAWRYHFLPPAFWQRLIGYFIAFAAISPGMFMAAQLYQHLGARHVQVNRTQRASRIAWGLILVPPVVIAVWVFLLQLQDEGHLGTIRSLIGTSLLLLGPGIACLIRRQSRPATAFAIGAGLVIWTHLARDPLGCMTLWVGLIYLLDPINAKLGLPSLIRDWESGRYGRTISLFAGGATCGLLWELWNYWAITKWTYNLSFLGQFEQYRYFEMPWIGFLGFLPFAAECWVMLNTIIAVMKSYRIRIAESLPDDHTVI